jgi:hypothetical protein
MVNSGKEVSENTLDFLANVKKLGYSVSEELLHALNGVLPGDKLKVFDFISDVTGVKLNWTPLVKGWDMPTGETRIDHIITFFANLTGCNKGVRLKCGHLIPDNTFPLERYNGCPFCGTPFEFGEIENYGQSGRLKVLELWTEKELNQFFKDLMESRTALNATQVDSLIILVEELPLPETAVAMKETLMILVDALTGKRKAEEAGRLFSSPNDILRYLWYKKTDSLQMIDPKTIVARTARNSRHISPYLNLSRRAGREKKEALKLKYNRAECRMVALWMNNLKTDARKTCEIMHPKRGMWVRFIRALRLSEYARKKGFGNLKELLDVFYNQTYEVWQGEVNRSRLKLNSGRTLELLKQRPGVFARSLFSNMLWFGAGITLEAFSEVADKLPARLILTLNMYSRYYFDPEQKRTVKPLGGTIKSIAACKLLKIYSQERLDAMISKVEDLCIDVIARRFSNIPTKSRTMYIDPGLFNIPFSIGDRNETIQDESCALAGTRFPVEGNSVRLFMQWGAGLPAQDLDMDLSCSITFERRVEVCSYYHLVATGCKHSGDVRAIPDNVGAAEYIELNIDKLNKAGALYVAFTCNAYSNGALSPNLMVGWMNSQFPMKISKKSGVAYDPSCVQHKVRVSKGTTKGLVFGLLDVTAREIIWLEMPFGGQIVANMSAKTLEGLIKKLNCKTTIGNLLAIKAKAQNITVIDDLADEIYTLQWALNTAAVTKLLVD